MPDISVIEGTPKPTELKVNTIIGPVTLVYDRNAMLPNVTSVVGMGMRDRLSRVLLSWDITKGEELLQPSPLADQEHWRTVVREGRELAHQLWEAERSRRGSMTEEVAAQQPPLDPEPPAVDAPITSAQMRAAHTSAWLDILLEMHSDLVREIDGGLLDDFLGVSWRAKPSPTSSSTGTSTATKRRGSTTESVAA